MTVVCEVDQEARLRAVRRYEVLDAPLEPALRRIADLAAVSCHAAVAEITWGEPDPGAGLVELARRPLVSPDGYEIGHLWVADPETRVLSADEEDVLTRLAALVVDHLELRLLARRSEEVVDQLQQGLLSNREIGKALGLLMAQYQLDDDAAFDKLRDHSRDLNVKLRLLAAEIVAHHNRGTRPLV
ncbi:ANTAR domain-containing protein [Nocardioides stalactiti]|uniref:ANTAR domain-containing protein n=1 Tax=Nocardioides stalactiti TaxID=2755356 RepID=UPI001603BA1A|nr:ANTAR domain-containing protein [Nocardioides stalactiti]